MYMYIYIYISVCVCTFISNHFKKRKHKTLYMYIAHSTMRKYRHPHMDKYNQYRQICWPPCRCQK